MQSNVLRKELAVIKQLGSQPFVTLLMPFDPKMTPKSSLEIQFKKMLGKIKDELYENYSFASAKDVSDKLVSLISSLNYYTHKKSLAVLVSSEEQKVYYLDVPVEERFFVDDAFHIRQLVHHKKDQKEYLLLVVSSKQASIYKGKDSIVSKILFNIPEYERSEWGKVSHPDSGMDDASFDKEAFINKFLKSTDNNLSIILSAFQLPVIVIASGSIINSYTQLSQNTASIAAVTTGDLDNASEHEIELAVLPYLNNWQRVKETYMLQQLEDALDAGMLEVGVQDVWNLTNKKNCKLLVVEEGYEYQAFLGKGLIVCAEEAATNAFTKDIVDDAIEKVLAGGGDVVFVSDGVLKEFMHIAAIRNY